MDLLLQIVASGMFSLRLDDMTMASRVMAQKI
jgi:hypothetical protein